MFHEIVVPAGVEFVPAEFERLLCEGDRVIAGQIAIRIRAVDAAIYDLPCPVDGVFARVDGAWGVATGPVLSPGEADAFRAYMYDLDMICGIEQTSTCSRPECDEPAVVVDLDSEEPICAGCLEHLAFHGAAIGHRVRWTAPAGWEAMVAGAN